ncbi:Clp protease N-terminal domain-containing protein [Streptomyces sp. UP1A-1]|nr:Clp protease N-terminal domain-containing protein [Streptomyces sp. UP1A-1]
MCNPVSPGSRPASKTPGPRPYTDADDRFGPELAPVVTGARRRAVRDGDRQIDTAHLLHSLLEHDADARAVLGDGPRIARLLGYLVQRSIGYGLRWQSAVEDSGAVPVVPGAAGFSPLAAAAMEDSRRAGRPAWTGPGRAASICSPPSSPTRRRAPWRCWPAPRSNPARSSPG